MSEPEIIGRKEAKARGLTQYFTGDACCRGHIDRRSVSSFGCMECQRIKDRGPTGRPRKLISAKLKEAKALGLKRFFTEQTCARGHLEEYSVSSLSCIECKKLYYQKNRERAAASGKKRRREHAEEVRAYQIKWQKSNPEKMKEYNRKWLAENYERKVESRRKWQTENRDRHLASIRSRSRKATAALRIIEQLAENDPNLKQLIGEIDDAIR